VKMAHRRGFDAEVAYNKLDESNQLLELRQRLRRRKVREKTNLLLQAEARHRVALPTEPDGPSTDIAPINYECDNMA
jgi:hypothetical protein